MLRKYPLITANIYDSFDIEDKCNAYVDHCELTLLMNNRVFPAIER